jgi:hypothetical protein
MPECLAFVTNALEEDGFVVRFINPNNLNISWENWIPSHVRQEFQKQTGNKIDGKGNITITQSEIEKAATSTTTNIPTSVPKGTREYMSTIKNRPAVDTRTSVYSAEIFEKIDQHIL